MKHTLTTLRTAFFCLFGALAVPAVNAALVVTPNTDSTALVNALVNGSGFAVSNANLIGATDQQGIFSGGVSSGIAIGSGVILSTGDARLAPGPNTNPSAGAQAGGPSDSELSALVGGGTTFDANVLTFTFTAATGGSLFFQYVFASEEYNGSVGTLFDDVFGLFIDGVNVALVPDTTTRVSVNSINCGNPYNPPNGANCSQFINNEQPPGDPRPPAPFDIQYDGFTTVLTASILGLVADQPYSIKLAIADVNDNNQDSAVFLAGRFERTDPNGQVPEPSSMALAALALFGLAAARRRARSA